MTGIGAGWTAPGWRTARSVGSDPWASGSAGVQLGGLGAAAISSSGGVSIDGLEWMGARVYDPAARGFLSVDPLESVAASGTTGNPYAFAGNDPLHSVDPTGLRPVTDAELQTYRDSNGVGGMLKSAASATGQWFKNNWEYVAGGAMVVAGGVLIATGVGGPAGMMLVSAGADTIIQKATTGEVNWGQVAVSGASGAIGFGAGGLLAKTALSTGAKEVVANVAEGVVSNGAGYMVGPGPHTPAGLLKSSTIGAVTSVGPVRGGAAVGDLESGATRMLNRTEEAVTGCFVAGTQVLMGDGSSKAIEDVRKGDEVVAADPSTGETHAREVVETFVHEDIPTWRVETTDGAVVSTSEHPFFVQGKGWVPVRELMPGDALVDAKGSEVSVVAVSPTGEGATVYNFHVDELHVYHVQSNEAWIRVHNVCPRGYDLRGVDPMSVVPGHAEVRELTPHPGAGSQYGLEFKWQHESGVTARMRIHGPDGTAPPGSNSASGETYRVQIGKQYQDEAGNLHHAQSHNPNSPYYDPSAANATHIPWPSQYPGL